MRTYIPLIFARINRFTAFATVLFFAVSVVSRTAAAQWLVNGVPICGAAAAQVQPAIISDGSGGAILCWADNRNASSASDLFAQRVNTMGTTQWTVHGVPVCLAPGSQGLICIVADESGGAIAAWSDYRSGSGDIYAQRISINGSALWANNGIPICATSGEQTFPSLVTDGTGGAIVVWEDARTGAVDLYAQRVSQSGTVLWNLNGVPVCSNPSVKGYSVASRDGAGGVLIAWSDSRNMTTEPDLYAQRVDPLGSSVWNSDGVVVCTAPRFQWNATIVSDGDCGAFVAWEDCRSDPLGECSYSDIYVQRVSAAGAAQWTANGIAITSTPITDSNPNVVAAQEGGVIIAWDRGLEDVYAQQIGPSGLTLWASGGIAACAASGVQYSNTIIADGTGGATIAWRHDVPNLADDIYATRINAAGQPLWGQNGLPVCTAPGEQQSPALVSDGWGGAILVWQDGRNGVNTDDIYAQRIMGSGSIPTSVRPVSRPTLKLSEPVPNPFSASTTMRLDLDRASIVAVQVYDAAGRLVIASEVNLGVGSHKLQFDGTDTPGRRLPSGVYFARVTVDGSSLTRKMTILR